MGSLPQLPEHFPNMTTLILVLTHTLYMMIQEEQDGQPSIAAGTFSEYDHLDLGSYSYFVYDIQEEQDGHPSIAAGTFSEYDHLDLGSYSYFVYDIQEEQDGQPSIAAGSFSDYDNLDIGSYSYFVYDIQEEQDGQPSIAAGTFSEYDHLDLGSYSYFVYDIQEEQDGQPLPQLPERKNHQVQTEYTAEKKPTTEIHSLLHQLEVTLIICNKKYNAL